MTGRFARIRVAAKSTSAGALAWRAGVGVAGLLIILVGVVLLVFPGPGWVVIFLGIGVWATEFAWARRLLDWTRARVLAFT